MRSSSSSRKLCVVGRYSSQGARIVRQASSRAATPIQLPDSGPKSAITNSIVTHVEDPGGLVSIVNGGRRNGRRSRDVRGGDAVAPLKRSLEVPRCSVVLDEAENRRSLLAAAHSQKLPLGVKRPEPHSPRARPQSSKVTVNQPGETRSRCDHAAAVFIAATGRTGWRGQPCDPALGQPRASSGMMHPGVTVRSSPRCSRGGRRRPRAALPSR